MCCAAANNLAPFLSACARIYANKRTLPLSHALTITHTHLYLPLHTFYTHCHTCTTLLPTHLHTTPPHCAWSSPLLCRAVITRASALAHKWRCQQSFFSRHLSRRLLFCAPTTLFCNVSPITCGLLCAISAPLVPWCARVSPDGVFIAIAYICGICGSFLPDIVCSCAALPRTSRARTRA